MLLGITVSAMAADPVVEAGKQVKLDYTLTVNNEQVETSVGKKPLEVSLATKALSLVLRQAF